jgi:hypothetical protein
MYANFIGLKLLFNLEKYIFSQPNIINLLVGLQFGTIPTSKEATTILQS